MTQIIRLQLSEARGRLTELRMHRVFQTLATRLAERAQRVDDCVIDLQRLIREKLTTSRQAWLAASAGVLRYDFRRLLGLKRAALDERATKVDTQFRGFLAERRNRLIQVEALLRERSPLTVLNRGYSITRDAQGRIVRDAGQVSVGDDVSIRLARGELRATVRNKKG